MTIALLDRALGEFVPTLTYNDMLNAYAEYPAPIRPYLLRTATHPAIISDLTRSARNVLLELVSRTPLDDPDRPILVKVANVATRLGISEKTVSRAIALMCDRKWLLAEPGYDRRNNYGEFAHPRFIVGTLLRRLIGLPLERRAPVHTPPQPVDNPPPETKMSAGVYGVNEGSSLKEASFKKEGQTPSIPASLAPLHDELGISLFGICALMRAAKAANQRLQDVWQAKRDQLRNAGVKEGRAKAYIAHLLASGEDFAYRARCSAPASGAGPVDALAAVALRCRHKEFVHERNGMRVRFFDGSAEVRRDGNYETYAGEQMQGLYKGVLNGNLREVIK